MKLLFIDTETALIRDKVKEKYHYINEQFKYEIFDINKEKLKISNTIVSLSLLTIDSENLDIDEEYFKPDVPIDINAEEIHLISNNFIKNKKDIKNSNIIRKLKEFSKDEIVIIGHNVNFDIQELKISGIDLSEYKIIDTLQLAKYIHKNIVKTNVEYHRLTYLKILYHLEPKINKIIKDYKLKNIQSHNSTYDVITTYTLYNILSKIISKHFNLKDIELIEKIIEISNQPMLLDTVPFGLSKGKTFESLSNYDIVNIMKSNIDDKNFLYSIENLINNKNTTIENIINSLTDKNLFSLMKSIENYPEYATNENVLNLIKRNYNNINNKLSFGKYKNVYLKEIPKDYLEWLLQQEKINPKIKENILLELKYR